MITIKTIVILISTFSIDSISSTIPNRLVIISLDGFRHDYYNRLAELTRLHNETNYLGAIGNVGVSAPSGVENLFITSTFPNHYTLATGLYEESHGIIDNYIYDPTLNETISLGNTDLYSKELLASYYRGMPIWANMVQQRSVDSVACYMWIGCNLPIANISLEHHEEFNATTNENCTNMVDWLRNETAIRDLIMMYHMEPDMTGHLYGPDSAEMNETLLVINRCIGEILSLIPDHNLLIVSDHGMIKYDDIIRIVVNDSLFTIRVYSNSVFMLECKPNQTSTTIDYLRANYANVSIYRKDEIPERWHYRNNKYITDVIIVADIGFNLLNGNQDNSSNHVGGHGYDNEYERMRPTFVARGPDLRNIIVDATTWHTVDVYLLMSTLLGIQPSPNNGSCAHVSNVLNNAQLIDQMTHCEQVATTTTSSTIATTTSSNSISIHNIGIVASLIVSLDCIHYIVVVAMFGK